MPNTTEHKAGVTAQLREGIREGSGLWFYDCPACPCDFGPMTRDKADAERQAREHDAEYHQEARKALGMPEENGEQQS